MSGEMDEEVGVRGKGWDRCQGKRDKGKVSEERHEGVASRDEDTALVWWLSGLRCL